MEENRVKKEKQTYVVKWFSTKTVNKNSMNKGEPQTNGARTTEYLMGQGGNLNPYLTLYTRKNFIYLCMYVCMAALGLRCCTQAFSVTASGGYSSLCCVDYSLRWLLLLQSTGSRCTGFSSCGTRASVVVHRLSSCGLRTLERRLSRCGARA